MSKHFVLIHGAWHGGWCWDGVIDILEKLGHTAEAPTLPGNAKGDDRSNITFDSYVQKIANIIEKQPEPVILVGHSSAGFLLQSAAPKVPDRIERLIFHNAAILANKTCQFDLVPPEQAQGMIAAANASHDNSVPVDEDLVRGAIMAGEPAEIQDLLIEHLVPQPIALFTTRINTEKFEKLDIPRTVLLCKDDAVLPSDVYLSMAQNLGQFNLIEIEGGHETLFTKPHIVARGLIKALA